MSEDHLTIEISNSWISDLGCEIKFHLSDYDFDGGSRIIIKYQNDYQYDLQDDEVEARFEVDKEYSVKICSREELINLRRAIDKTLEAWPLIFGDKEECQ